MKNYFSRDYIDFFHDLEKNNNDRWFSMNKGRFEEYVYKPFKEFLDDLIPELGKIDPKVHQDVESALYKIERNVRYTRNKEPYYTMMRAGISREGRRSGFAGYYLGIGADMIIAGGGVFSNNSLRIRNIREIIANNHEDFVKIVHNKEFQKNFGEMKTETSRRLSPQFAGLMEKVPEIARKQFYFMKKKEDAEALILSDKLKEFFMEVFRTIKPYNKFFNRALENSISA